MIGGKAEVVESLASLLGGPGQDVRPPGRPGAGQHTKLVNQILIAGNMVGVCEALLYAYKVGLDLELVMQSVAAERREAGRCEPGSADHGQRLRAGLPRRALHQGLGVSMDEARRAGLCLPGLALANQLYLSLVAHGHGRDGTQALQLALAAMSNVDWRKR